MTYTCKHCNEKLEFDKFQQFGGHITNCLKNPNNSKISLERKRNKKIEEYFLTPKKCDFCEKGLDYKKRHNKFCSSSCSAKATNPDKKGIKRNFSDEGLQNIRESNYKKRLLKNFKCKICEKYSNNKFYCSKICKEKGYELFKLKCSEVKKKFYDEFPEKHPNRLCAGKCSYPEKMLKDFFLELNLIEGKDFIRQYKVERYFLDFYLPKLNLGIEVDGKQWHKDKEREEKREEIIKKYHNLKRFDAKDLIKKKYDNEIRSLVELIL